MASGNNRKTGNKTAPGSYGNTPAANVRKGGGFDFSKMFKKIGNIVFVAVIAYFVFSIFSQQSIISENNAEIASLNEQISEKQIEIERLEQEYANIDSDEYIERMAREKLGLVQANERVYKDSSKRQ